MSLEHSPARQGEEDPAFWNNLIDEQTAGNFVGLVARTMQKMRQTGGGPTYIRISSRCVRYRRIDLKAWADARARRSTSDPGPGASA